MMRRTAHRGVQAVSVLAVLAVLMLSSSVSAHAATVVERFSDSHTETFTGPLEFCLPEDRVGTVTITESSTGQVVDTPVPPALRISNVHCSNLGMGRGRRHAEELAQWFGASRS